MFFRRLSVVSVFLSFLLCLPVYSASQRVEFSTEAVQFNQQGQIRTIVMYVGQDAIRREYTAQGQKIIEILRAGDGMMYTLFPAKKAYMQIKTPGVSPFFKSGAVDTNPCKASKQDTCKHLGKEKVNGRVADKWEVSRKQGNQVVRALMWVDVERGQALRQFFPDGTVVEMQKSGDAKLYGRKTEKWEMTVKRPDGKSSRSLQWYDPELGIVVREEIPGGFVRELRKIKIGKQPNELFKIPSEYRKMEKSGTTGK
jgi:hypothetical protein